MFKRFLQRLRTIAPWQRTLYILFVAQFVTAIGFSTIFPFLPLYVQELGTRTSLSIEFLAGMVFSAQAITMMIASPVWGALADRFGRKLMVQRAMFGGSIIILLMAFVRSAEELVLLRAIQGLITGTVSAANALAAASAPRGRSGYAMGLLQVGLWGGVALGPLIGGTIADLVGYSEAFVVTAVLLAAAGSLVLWGVEEVAAPSGDKGSAHPLANLTEWRNIVGASGVLPAYLLRFLGNLGRSLIIPFAPLFMGVLVPNSERVNTLTGLMIGAAAASSTATAVYLGRLGDRIGHRRVLKASALATGLFYLPQGLVDHAWQLILLQILTGFAFGGILPSISALLARYTVPGEEGRVYGLENSVRSASRALAPLAGAGIAAWFGLRTTFAATGLIFILVALLSVWKLPEAAQETQQTAAQCAD